MKKHNPLAVLILIAANLAVGCLTGIALGALTGIRGFNWMILITIPLFLLLFPNLTNLFVFPIARKTMEKNLAKQHFGKTTTFINTDLWSLRKMLCIDEDTGRVAYVSVTNPFKFQMVHATELNKITTAYMVGPFGGTRYVYFEFCHGNTRFRFPTFRTRTMWFVSSTHVQDAIATGENICNLLLRFNPSGADFSKNNDIPFSKTGLKGFIFAFISIYFAIAAVLSEFYISTMAGLDPLSFSGIPAYAITFAGAAFAVTGIVLGIKALRGASAAPVRGRGFAKTAVIMSSIVLAILLLSLVLFIRG
ncbi:MAG: hypothetical protein K5875_04220 [Saccharofermentans sp.]|nr:hypothetical protein [Saccharofermentans sp.]